MSARRRFRSFVPLVLLLALAALPAAAQDAAALLQAGPMVGYGTHRAVRLWVQTTEPAEVQIRYWDEETPDAPVLTPPVRTTAAESHTAHVQIAYLEPGRRFGYEVVLNGETVERPYPLRFQTQPLWQWRTDPPAFTVAFGSCAYVNDPAYDRPGDPYGGDYEIFETIAAQQPDVMLWLGDNVYYREVDWTSPEMMDYRYAHTRALPEMQPLLGAAHNLATWDDHDYGPNDSSRDYVFKGAALDVFQRYWANPTYGLPGIPGVFTHFTWGDVDFFLLDNRFHRSPSTAPADGDKTMLGAAQLQWLIDALTVSRAPFKVVVNGGQMLNQYDVYENFAVFPAERQRLLDAVAERGIDGVLFLSGDRHHTELLRLEREGTYTLFDFTSSPLTAGTGWPRQELENEARVEGTLVTQRNFGTLTFFGPRTDRKVELRTYSTEGELLWTYTLSASDLVTPGE